MRPSFGTIKPTREDVASLLSAGSISKEFQNELSEYIRIMGLTISKVLYQHHPENHSIIKKHNSNIRDLRRISDDKISNVTAIIIQCKGESVTFHRNFLTSSMFRKLLAKRPSNMSKTGSFREITEYFTTDEITLPAQPWEMPDVNQVFTKAIECAIPFSKSLLQAGYKKNAIRKFIERVIGHYFPDVMSKRNDDNTNSQAFKKNVWQVILKP